MNDLNLVGKTLGPYEILAEVGRGGMAIVYRAYQPSLNRVVAIKVLPPALTLDREFVSRFVREAQAAASLRHPNILVVHDVAQQAGLYYIAMEYLEGQTLGQTIRQEGGLSPDRVVNITRQIASALDYAHQRGIVHRDIKPSNIFIGPGDQVTLTDFGIAKAAGDTALTRTGKVMGTPQYMAPEQAEAGTAGGEADQYALAIVVYEMLTGRVPFQADSPHAVLYKQVHEPPPALPAWRSDLPAALNQVLSRALNKDPRARYLSAGAFAKALAQAHSGRAPTLPATAPTPKVQRRGAPGWLLAATAIVALAVIGLGAFLLLRPKGEGEAQVALTTAPLPTTPVVSTPTNPFATATTPAIPPAAATTPATLPPLATTPAAPPTHTATPTPTSSPTPTGTSTPTLTPSPSPTPPCAIAVDPQLAPTWDRARLGCPTANAAVVWAAWEPFQRGYMLWRSDNDWAYVLHWQNGSNPAAGDWATGGNAWRWDGSFPDGRGLTPPPGLLEPIRGFGYVWFNFLGGAASTIGWATDQEKGFCANLQPFDTGLIFHSSTVQFCQDELFNWATHPSFTPLFFTMRADGTWTRY